MRLASSVESKLRLLGRRDLSDLLELSTLAEWNQTSADWRMLLDLAPDGCFGIEIAGRIVASASLVSHAATVGWIGMVLTHPSYRRQGLARKLVARVVERAKLLNIPTVKLDATEEGRPLYESFGFRAEQDVERWIRNGETREPAAIEPCESANLARIDYDACGYDRARMLRALAIRSEIGLDPAGYLFRRAGRLCAYLGPWVAQDKAAAGRLITAALQRASGAAWYWDLLPSNRNAVALAGASGFTPVRRLIRMVLGRELLGKPEWIYGLAGFELG